MLIAQWASTLVMATMSVPDPHTEAVNSVRRVSIRWAALGLLASCVFGCGGGASTTSSDAPFSGGEGGLNARYAQYDFSNNPKLLERVASRPFGYYRFVNVPFADEVCSRFSDALKVMPRVNLHGDAHLEQYTVTSAGRGLADFDDSSTGPAIIDLVRFGVALSLAHAQRGWGNVGASIDAFFKGYRDALRDPEVKREAPGFEARAAGRFNPDRAAFLKWAEGLMQPLGEQASEHLSKGFARYAENIRKRKEGLSETFFDLKRFGSISVGVGSALDQKYLLRIEGPTEDPGDDLILEAKEVRDLSGIRCINSGPGGGALRILVSKARITERPQPFLAEIPMEADASIHDTALWIHAWFADYEELVIMKSLASAEELRVIAYDVGAQLGRGHTLHIAAPFDEQLRTNQRRVLDTYEARIRQAIREMTRRSINGWRQFRADAAAAGEKLPEGLALPEISDAPEAPAQKSSDK